MAQKTEAVPQAALSMSLTSVKLSETELDDRVTKLEQTLGSRLGPKFKAGIRALWGAFRSRGTVPISEIADEFPSWELSKSGCNIFQVWDCSLLLTPVTETGLSEIFGLQSDQVKHMIDDKAKQSPEHLTQSLATQLGYSLTTFKIRGSGQFDAASQFVIEVTFSESQASRGESVIAVNDAQLYQVFSAPPVDLGTIGFDVRNTQASPFN
jgi:hypothetical protein